MNRTDTWLKIKSKFAKQLDTFKADNLETSVIIEQLETLCLENTELDEKCQQELLELVNSANLSAELTDKLLNSLGDQKTRFFQQPSASITTEEKVEISHDENTPSSLLKELLSPIKQSLPTLIKPSQTIRSTYYTESKIGSGGMGEVWKALDLIQDAGEAKDKYVAIKFINQEIRSHPYALKALVREFARYKKLIHPNIVKAYELNRDGNEIFIAMEYLEGTALSEFIKKHPAGVSLEQAHPIIKGMCDALEYAHQEGIVHLDFKPGNVFYNPETKLCKVIDFGIARLTDPEERDKTRFDPGTLGAMTTSYASCEMQMELDPDSRDDVYGLACVIYELLAGHHPFDKTTALKAERERKVPKSIKGLAKDEFQAIVHGLAFNKANRTASAQQLYSELFHPQQIAKQKWIKWSIATGLVVVSLFASYQAYNHWQLSEVKAVIEDSSRSGIASFTALSLEEQKELFLDPSIRLALVKDVSNTDSEDLLLRKISQFDGHIQQLLFADRNVREHLINAYHHKIGLSIRADNFQQADMFSQDILQQYPDSLHLVSLAENIKRQKISRQKMLRQQYHQCLDDQNQTLLMLFPCLQETKALIRKIDSSDGLLITIDSALSNRYVKEVSLAIKQNELVLAETLVFNWQNLEQGEITSRTEFIKKLAFANKVDLLIEQIMESNNIQLTEVLIVFSEQEQAFKHKVLIDTAVKSRLLDYYHKTTEQLLDLHQFSTAKQRIANGNTLFSKGRKELKKLKVLDKKITTTKTRYLADLEKRYKQELAEKEPNTKVIQTMLADLTAVAPDHMVIKLPKLLDSYSKKIDSAIIKEQFELADRLFNGWSLLKPSDAKSKSFIELTTKKANILQAYQDRNVFTEKLKLSIENNQLETVSRLIKELKNQLSDKEQKKVISKNKQPLLDIYQQHINEKIKQDKFSLATDVFTQMKFVFPKEKLALRNKKTISKAKGQRIKDLLVQSKEAMKLATLDSSLIFLPLHKINLIDSKYFNTQPVIFKKLKKTLVQKLGQESSILQVQRVIEQWKTFIIDSPHMSDSSKDIFRKTQNMIALRCLFSGRKAKARNKISEANKLFMFGLSLDPVNSVKIALEEELF